MFRTNSDEFNPSVKHVMEALGIPASSPTVATGGGEQAYPADASKSMWKDRRDRQMGRDRKSVIFDPNADDNKSGLEELDDEDNREESVDEGRVLVEEVAVQPVPTDLWKFKIQGTSRANAGRIHGFLSRVVSDKVVDQSRYDLDNHSFNVTLRSSNQQEAKDWLEQVVDRVSARDKKNEVNQEI